MKDSSMGHEQIKEIRGRLDLSQERFAQLLGVSLQTVWRWESGLTKPLPIINSKLEQLQKKTMARKRTTGGIPPAGGIPRAGGIPMRGARREKGGTGAELGLGGLFKGIGSLLDLVSTMAEEGEEETTRSGEVEALGGKLKGIYGFSVRMGLGGKPVIQQFGNIQETETGVEVAETREPLVDVLDEGDYLLVIAELPGVEERDTNIDVTGDVLEITAEAKDRNYRKEVLLPFSVDRQSLASSYRNGILEIKLAKP